MTEYAFVPTHDDLSDAVQRTMGLPIPDLKRSIRRELQSADAIAALLTLANRAQSEHTVITYRDYLRSEVWQEKRALKFGQQGRRCERCASSTMLQIHHKTYERLGNELLSDLEVLCDSCHKAQHGKEA